MKYKAVIFDLDGTLLDTIGDIAAAMNHALKNHGMPTHEETDYYGMVGWGLDELVRRAIRAGLDEQGQKIDESVIEQLVPELSEEWMAYYRSHPADKTVPYDGIEGLLTALVEANVSIGVLSNKPEELVTATVAKLLPNHYFAAVHGQSEAFPHKPEPNLLLHILDHLNLAPEEACMVGDSEIDMKTARNAGVEAVAVSWGFRSLETLREAGAEVVAHSTRELREHLLKA